MFPSLFGHFIHLWHNKMFQERFTFPVLRLSLFSKSPVSLYWKMTVGNQDLGSEYAHCYWYVTVLYPLSGQAEENSSIMFSLTPLIFNGFTYLFKPI